MRTSLLVARIFAVWISLSLALPAPAQALRTLQARHNTGLEEELTQVLSAGSFRGAQGASAGLEEGAGLRPEPITAETHFAVGDLLVHTVNPDIRVEVRAILEDGSLEIHPAHAGSTILPLELALTFFGILHRRSVLSAHAELFNLVQAGKVRKIAGAGKTWNRPIRWRHSRLPGIIDLLLDVAVHLPNEVLYAHESEQVRVYRPTVERRKTVDLEVDLEKEEAVALRAQGYTSRAITLKSARPLAIVLGFPSRSPLYLVYAFGDWGGRSNQLRHLSVTDMKTGIVGLLGRGAFRVSDYLDAQKKRASAGSKPVLSKVISNPHGQLEAGVIAALSPASVPPVPRDFDGNRSLILRLELIDEPAETAAPAGQQEADSTAGLEEDVERYARYAGKTQSPTRRLVEMMQKAGLGPGQMVADVGSGTGGGTSDVADVVERGGGHVIGLDRDARMVGYARQRAHGVNSMEFHVGEGIQMAMHVKAPLDAITAFNLIHELDDGELRALLAQWRATLSVGALVGLNTGFFAGAVTGRTAEGKYFERIVQAARRIARRQNPSIAMPVPRFPGSFMRPASDYQKIFEEAGFEIIQQELIPMEMDRETLHLLMSRPTVTDVIFPAGVLPSAKRAIMEKAVDQVLEKARRENGLTSLSRNWLDIVVRSREPATGLKERLGMAERAWRDVRVTPSYDGVTKRMLPVFYAGETFRALPAAAKAGPVVALAGSQAGLEEVRALLERLSIPPDRYPIQVIGEEGLPGALARVERQFSGPFHVYPVDPGRPDWLRHLLAGLEEQGELPVGDLGPAIEAARDYFQFV